MRALIALTLLSFATCLPASARQRFQGYCTQGGTKAMTLMVHSTTIVQQSFPSCTVNVYMPGTTTHVSIYADDNGTVKSNPFTADTTGYYFFYADDGAYDVNFSGGGISAPFTSGDVRLVDPYFTYTSNNDGTTRYKISQTISITDKPFLARTGAVGTNLCAANAAAITAALTAALAAGSSDVMIPPGVFPTNPLVTPYITDPFHSPKIRGPGVLQSCAAGTLLTIRGGVGWKLENLYLDCNNIGTNGLLTSLDGSNNPTDDIDATSIQIRNCTNRGLALDSNVNSHWKGIKLYGSKLPLSITNGANDVYMLDVEAQGTSTSNTLVYMGADSTLPGALGGPGSLVSFLTIERSIFECNGALPCPVSGTTTVDLSNANTVVLRDIAINLNGTPGANNPALVHFGVSSYNNAIYNSVFDAFGVDMKIIVNENTNAGGANAIRDSNILFTNGAVTCKKTAITSRSLLILDNITTNLPKCLTVADTSGSGIGTTIKWIPSASYGNSYFGNPPTGTIGSFYYGANGPEWWVNNKFVDVNGNPPGQCHVYQGAGSPNGVVTANACDRYWNTAANGKVPALWVKEGASGGNTGWKGQADGYYVQCTGSGIYTFTSSPQTIATCALDVNGVWEISGTTVSTVCVMPDICQAQITAMSQTNSVSTGVYSTTYLTVDPIIVTVTAAPRNALFQIKTAGAAGGRSTTRQTRVMAKLLYAL
jgi:hypothetical protein